MSRSRLCLTTIYASLAAAVDVCYTDRGFIDLISIT